MVISIFPTKIYELNLERTKWIFGNAFFIPSKSHWVTGAILAFAESCKNKQTEIFTKDQFQGVKILAHKQDAQCAQKGGQMLVFVICGFIKNFLPNSYFILQIYHAKSFKK